MQYIVQYLSFSHQTKVYTLYSLVLIIQFTYQIYNPLTMNIQCRHIAHNLHHTAESKNWRVQMLALSVLKTGPAQSYRFFEVLVNKLITTYFGMILPIIYVSNKCITQLIQIHIFSAKCFLTCLLHSAELGLLVYNSIRVMCILVYLYVFVHAIQYVTLSNEREIRYYENV